MSSNLLSIRPDRRRLGGPGAAAAPRVRPPGRLIEADQVRGYVDAILYILRTGCPWRHLPHDFAVSWSAAHQQFMRWTRRGVWDTTLVALRQRARLAEGREAAPTGAVVDSSSGTSSPTPPG